ncbi:hypothetical protein [Streptomyces sp. MZ04]|uniref:hypothetical protein n=1 Tax=Streptomyces sp. MZ04 TaxID=2559236 RepID=UPI00107ED8F8|nr:hypothetical protein [Streptomyces sp. MZ04]TGB08909.1 hypothetical protein E2651_17590 [Streptomyces sp. MZ04]
MRGRGAGCAVALVMLLAGCGESADSGERTPTERPTAAGADGRADPGKVFTEAELTAALLPAKAIGEKARASETSLGLFDLRFGGGDWGNACEPPSRARVELGRLRGTSAENTVRPDPRAVSDGDPYVSQRLVSMPAERAGRYLVLRKQLHDSCSSVVVDTEAAPVTEKHTAQKLPDLGDDALLETLRTTGGDEYDGTPHYEVEARVGGVLVIVSAAADKELTLSAAAKAVRRVRTELYNVS